ncbi:Cytochrome c551 peroxidase precursor [Thalassovita gelatinovora]|uniref:Cytochrome c551 peroxidase n=1 Tax=Thalassovita gelatinovora TaxID=53501 RepID=A0A0P1F427_THAGE|nr:cytochrome c peroxidase [Thalassovita gelatinovora]QIZ79283.1 cytochrome-c peroxidase [Thalassovita gelatinovora]CUH62500.1 Cytochrome c551 peroxidase precursor [Thalassovita gelatinovora]SEQ05529.1 cytochrome c peroxidase [Thalassovita gelatinovora]
MKNWIAVGALTLQAGLLQAANLPAPVDHDTFPEPDMARVKLGQQLFYDPVLSGNENISCATCHHPKFGSADGVSLSIGEGGTGLGPDRKLLNGANVENRVPRNAPALWNVGAVEYTAQFHDGRVEVEDDATFGFMTPRDRPLDRLMPSSLAVQALMPLLSAEEMLGQDGENPVADALERGNERKGWKILAARIDAIPEYRTQFDTLIGSDTPVHITDIAIAMAEFINFEFQACESPFDAYLAGDETALNDKEKRGMDLFYGKAGCADCHSGTFQSDQDFHAIGVPQFGPGKGDDELDDRPYVDLGREMVTGDPRDSYRFRTPSLRNVALTAPYGHSGAFPTLEGMVRHHLDPVKSLVQYDRRQAILHDVDVINDWQAFDEGLEVAFIAAAIELEPTELSDGEVDDILAFLNALTDAESTKGRLGIPETVPSGLPVDR